jgi:hypothetical protein
MEVTGHGPEQRAEGFVAEAVISGRHCAIPKSCRIEANRS